MQYGMKIRSRVEGALCSCTYLCALMIAECCVLFPGPAMQILCIRQPTRQDKMIAEYMSAEPQMSTLVTALLLCSA